MAGCGEGLQLGSLNRRLLLNRDTRSLLAQAYLPRCSHSTGSNGISTAPSLSTLAPDPDCPNPVAFFQPKENGTRNSIKHDAVPLTICSSLKASSMPCPSLGDIIPNRTRRSRTLLGADATKQFGFPPPLRLVARTWIPDVL